MPSPSPGKNIVQIPNPEAGNPATPAFANPSGSSAFAPFNKPHVAPPEPSGDGNVSMLKFDKIQQMLAAEANNSARLAAIQREETPQLTFKELEAMSTPIGFTQLSPFGMRKISSPVGHPSMMAFHAYGMGLGPQFQSQTNSPAYFPTRSPLGFQQQPQQLQQPTGYVDFSAALSDNYQTPSQLPGTASARGMIGYLSALSPLGYNAPKK